MPQEHTSSFRNEMGTSVRNGMGASRYFVGNEWGTTTYPASTGQQPPSLVPGPHSSLLFSSLLFSAAMLECRQRLPAPASASARGGSAIVLRSERASERAHGAAVGVSGEGEGRARARRSCSRRRRKPCIKKSRPESKLFAFSFNG